MSRFDELLVDIPELYRVGYIALRPWGYSFEDAGQEALIALWKVSKMDTIPKYPLSYISRTLINREIDKIRTPEGRTEHFEYIEVATTDNQDWFPEITKGLKGDDKNMLYLKYIFGYSGEELAEIYNVRHGTIKSRLNRLCKRISDGKEIETR